MRHALFLFVLLAAAPAHAQKSDAETAWDEVQQRSAEIANSQNCQVACRALESLSRATKRLCDIGPEHCEEAKAKLRDAEQRVRTTCPDCEVKTVTPTERPQNQNVPPAPPPPTTQDSAGSDTVMASPEKRGGCAGCSAAPSAADGFGIAALALVLLRNKKRRKL
jgi:hypothetical protein